MGQLKLTITFHGGKAEQHRMSATTLAKVFQAISDDIQNVYRVVSHADVNVTLDEIKRESKLYLSAEPAAGSFKLHFISEETPNEWVEISGKEYGRGLRMIGSGHLESEILPLGITKSVLQNAKVFANPRNNEYERMELTIPQAADADIDVVFDKRFSVAIEKQLIEIETRPAEIHGYEIEGILHALDDQDYTKPTGRILVKVASHDGDWVCSIEKQELPMDINEYWGKRVFMRGFATFRPRKRTLIVEPESFEILPGKPNLVTAAKRFIEINEKMWEGQDPTEYLDSVREKHK
jgi:hypothetical protein